MLTKAYASANLGGADKGWSGIHEYELPDDKLMILIAAGEGWAFAKIYERYSRLVFHTALKYIHDRPGAEEIVQEVFFKAWRFAGDYRPERSRLSTWLIRITQNQCIDELRRRRVRPTGEVLEDEMASPPAAIGDPGDALDHALERARVASALQRIPDSQRTVVELAFFEGLSHPEIASRCGDPLGTVKTRLRLGMKKLKGLLEEE